MGSSHVEESTASVEEMSRVLKDLWAFMMIALLTARNYFVNRISMHTMLQYWHHAWTVLKSEKMSKYFVVHMQLCQLKD